MPKRLKAKSLKAKTPKQTTKMEIQEGKRRSRVLIGLTSTAILLALGYFGLLYFMSRPLCKLPVSYEIGSLDERFDINQKDFEKSINTGAFVWNSQMDQEIFNLSEGGVRINLIYDERQAQIDKLNAQSSEILESEGDLESMDKRFARLAEKYKQDLTEFNRQVEYWNSQGGAPEGEYNKLKQIETDLDKTRTTLNEMSAILNEKVAQHNNQVDDYNEEVEQSKDKIITQGEYDPNNNTINIYTFGDMEELEFVVAHELGHATNLDHVDNTKSLMYYLVKDQDIKNPTLSNEDKQQLIKTCNLNTDFFRPNWSNLKFILPNTTILK